MDITPGGIKSVSVFDPSSGTAVKVDAVRNLSYNEEDQYFTTGNGLRRIVGTRRMLSFECLDHENVKIIQDWADGTVDVQAVGLGVSHNIQWYEDSFVNITPITMAFGANNGYKVELVNNLRSASVYTNANLMQYQGWTDSTIGGVPDGWTLVTNSGTATGGSATVEWNSTTNEATITIRYGTVTGNNEFIYIRSPYIPLPMQDESVTLSATRVSYTINNYESDFSAGFDGWTKTTLSDTATIEDGIFGEDDVLKIYAEPTNQLHTIGRDDTANPANGGVMVFDYYIPSSNTNVDGIRVSDGSTWDASIDVTYDSWQTASYERSVWANDRVSLRLESNGSQTFTGAGPGDDIVYFKNIRFYTPFTDDAYDEARAQIEYRMYEWASPTTYTQLAERTIIPVDGGTEAIRVGDTRQLSSTGDVYAFAMWLSMNKLPSQNPSTIDVYQWVVKDPAIRSDGAITVTKY